MPSRIDPTHLDFSVKLQVRRSEEALAAECVDLRRKLQLMTRARDAAEDQLQLARVDTCTIPQATPAHFF